jgi:predicted glycosyltransferase
VSGRGRVLLYVQHLLGIGHLQRAAIIARAMEARGLEVTFVSGGRPVPGLDLGAMHRVQLPPAMAAPDWSLLDLDGAPVTEAWQNHRRRRLLEAFAAARPHCLVVFCSVRDILVAPVKAVRAAEAVARVNALFDGVLVHSDPALVPFEATFPATDQIADKLQYTGYVVGLAPAPTPGSQSSASGEVLVSTGGGAVSRALVEAALAARPLSCLKDRRWRILVGHNLPEAEFRALGAAAPAGVEVERARPDFVTLLTRAGLSISQAGYNTALEVMSAGVPAVLVPFSGGGENEQTTRARLLAERGGATVVNEHELSGETLARAIEAALRSAGRPSRAPLRIDIDGARRTAEIVARATRDVRAQEAPALDSTRRFRS